MGLITYDDGSTLDTGSAGTPGAATNAPVGMLVSDYAANFAPGSVTQGAVNWTDVLKYGIGRVADGYTASITPQNSRPQYMAQDSGVGGQSRGISTGAMLLIGVGVLAAVLLASGGKK